MCLYGCGYRPLSLFILFLPSSLFFSFFFLRFVSQTLSCQRATSPAAPRPPSPPPARPSPRWTRVISLSRSPVCPGLPRMFVYPRVLLLQFVLGLRLYLIVARTLGRRHVTSRLHASPGGYQVLRTLMFRCTKMSYQPSRTRMVTLSPAL